MKKKSKISLNKFSVCLGTLILSIFFLFINLNKCGKIGNSISRFLAEKIGSLRFLIPITGILCAILGFYVIFKPKLKKILPKKSHKKRKKTVKTISPIAVPSSKNKENSNKSSLKKLLDKNLKLLHSKYKLPQTNLLDCEEFRNSESNTSILIGENEDGKQIVYDLTKFPHLLIAGSTGSGKSVFINTLIMSLLLKAKPSEVKLILIDPKIVELTIYNGIPHLLCPVITDMNKVQEALEWTIKEMMRRYDLLSKFGLKNIEDYNTNIARTNKNKLPKIVIIIDEFADLIMQKGSLIEDTIARLTALARAAGIHMVLATQRPSAKVITGIIKANIPSRISFNVASSTDSRIILDKSGAEELQGNGQMLFSPQGKTLQKLQGPYLSDEEIKSVLNEIKNQ